MTTVTGLRPSGGGSVGSVRVSVGATTSGLDAEARGTVADRRRQHARRARGDRLAADVGAGVLGGRVGLTEGSVSGLSVDGAPVAAGPGSRVEVPGIGTLVFMEQVSDGAGGRPRQRACAWRSPTPTRRRSSGSPSCSATSTSRRPPARRPRRARAAQARARRAGSAPAGTVPGTTAAPPRPGRRSRRTHRHAGPARAAAPRGARGRHRHRRGLRLPGRRRRELHRRLRRARAPAPAGTTATTSSPPAARRWWRWPTGRCRRWASTPSAATASG